MLIGEIKCRPGQKCLVQIRDFDEGRFVDIRVYDKDPENDWKPTRQGISIPVAKVGKLVELIQKAETS